MQLQGGEMNHNQLIDRAFIGLPVIPIYNPLTKTFKEGGSIMTREELTDMTKKDLNAALTPFTGGYAPRPLQDKKKEDMIDELLQHQKKAAQEKKSTTPKKAKGAGVVDTIVTSLKGGWKTKVDIIAVLSTTFPDRDPRKMMSTINTQLHRLKTKHNVEKNKTEVGVKYRITVRG